MKTLLQNTARLIVVATATCLGITDAAPAQGATARDTAVAASVGQPVGIEQVDDFVYLVRVSNPALQRGTLQLIRESDGTVLYEDVSFQPSFGKKLNVTALDDGLYAVVVKVGDRMDRFALRLRTTTQRTTDLRLATTAQR